MSDVNQGVTFNLNGLPPVPPQPPRQPTSWATPAPRDPEENWRYIRRNEIGQYAIPFVVALTARGDAVLVGEAWQGDANDAEQEARDRAIVDRAVRIATMLQDAIDKARPR